MGAEEKTMYPILSIIWWFTRRFAWLVDGAVNLLHDWANSLLGWDEMSEEAWLKRQVQELVKKRTLQKTDRLPTIAYLATYGLTCVLIGFCITATIQIIDLRWVHLQATSLMGTSGVWIMSIGLSVAVNLVFLANIAGTTSPVRASWRRRHDYWVIRSKHHTMRRNLVAETETLPRWRDRRMAFLRVPRSWAFGHPPEMHYPGLIRAVRPGPSHIRNACWLILSTGERLQWLWGYTMPSVLEIIDPQESFVRMTGVRLYWERRRHTEDLRYLAQTLLEEKKGAGTAALRKLREASELLAGHLEVNNQKSWMLPEADRLDHVHKTLKSGQDVTFLDRPPKEESAEEPPPEASPPTSDTSLGFTPDNRPNAELT